ncbi:hypothetical protein GCM10023148_03220 [Actinokineospora soli]
MRVEEGVGGAVVDLAEAADHRGHRRAQHDEVQLVAAEHRRQRERAGELRREHPLGRGPVADLDDAATGTRRERIATSISSAKSYQAGLLSRLISDLRQLRHVMVIGDAMRRIPALAFTVADRKAGEVVDHLADLGICAFADDTPTGVFATLGVGEVGGAVRVGLAHYTTSVEVDQLVSALSR